MILKAVLSLANLTNPIVVYPIHDCLLCKRSDEDEVVTALWEAMSQEFGRTPSLDVEYSDQPTELIEAEFVGSSDVEIEVPQGNDDDFDVIEEWDE